MSTSKVNHFHLIEDMDISAMTFAAIERIETFAVSVTTVLNTWIRRSNERRLLAMLNGRMMDDIGLSYHEVRAEVDKYFWQK